MPGDGETHQVQVGDRVRDNDPRRPDHLLVVTGFVDVPLGRSGTATVRKAVLRDEAGRERRMSVGSIHVDGKLRRSGWSLVVP